MKIHSMNHLNNTFLVAMPSMHETWFNQSVILICDHEPDSTMGIVLNKPMGMQLGELFEQLDIPCDDMNLKGIPVYKGGPVQVERGFVLHSSYRDAAGTTKIGEDLYLSTSREVLVDIAQGNGPDRFFVALGYAGWGENQLADEICANAWLNASSNNDLIFDLPIYYRWEEAVKEIGFDIKHISSAVGHA